MIADFKRPTITTHSLSVFCLTGQFSAVTSYYTESLKEIVETAELEILHVHSQTNSAKY